MRTSKVLVCSILSIGDCSLSRASARLQSTFEEAERAVSLINKLSGAEERAHSDAREAELAELKGTG